MNSPETAIFIFLLFLFPAFIAKGARKIPLVKSIGAIPVCYIIGIAISLMPFDYEADTINLVASVALVIAIPLILMEMNIKAVHDVAGKMLLSFLLIIAAVIIAELIIYCYIKGLYTDNIEELVAMTIGSYIGGTPNLLIVGDALLSHTHQELIICASTIDIIIGGIYLLPLLTIGRKFYGRMLGFNEALTEKANDGNLSVYGKTADFSLIGFAGIIALSAALTALGALIEYLVNGNLNGSLFIIVTVSAGGILLSSSEKIRNIKGGYEFGNYLICVFSFGISMCIDITQITPEMVPLIILFAVSLPACVLLHILFCKIAKIDGDTAMLTSVAGIFGPQHVVIVTETYNLKSLAIPGVICGVLGFAIGTFAGLGIGFILIGI